MRVFVNGVEGGRLPADDPGVTRGLNVFETFRTYGPIPFRLPQHMARLQRSAAAFGIAVPEGVEARLRSHCALNVVVRVMLTGGGNEAIQVYPVPNERIGRPVAVAAVDYAPPLGFAKHGSRGLTIAMAAARGVEEVLFTSQGELLEAARSNLFAVVDGQWVTPPGDGRILEGVTRGALLDLGGIREGAVRLEDCEELWLSSTLKELAPAIVDGVERSGPMGRALHQAFRAALPVSSSEAPPA